MPYYGTNGFYLPFKNNASTTTLGWDYSGDTTARYNAAANGNAQISTAQSKFGGSSAFFDGTGDYLGFTYSTAFQFGTQNFTIEGWIRISSLTVGSTVFFSGNDGNYFNGIIVQVNTDGSIQGWIGDASSVVSTSSTASVIAANTWYHFAYVRNGNSLKFYVNGTEVASSTSSISVGAATINASTSIGRLYGTSNQQKYLNGYLDDFRIYRGVAKYTAAFTAPINAIPLGADDPNWQYCLIALPLNGTNGSTTFAVHAPNNWTPNNFSVTAGAGNDSMIDVPTPYADGGNNRGNYCTLNPIRNTSSNQGTFSNGNLQVAGTASTINCFAAGTMVFRGKMYCEMTVGAVGNDLTNQGIGIIPKNNYTLSTANFMTSGIYYIVSGSKRVSGVSSAYGSSYTTSDVIGIAVDTDAETITFYKNNVSQGTISGAGIISAGVEPYIGFQDSGSPWVVANFGQRPFSYTPPAGFKAMNTFNLP